MPDLQKLLISVGAAALLAGCAVGPDFQQPAAPAVPGYTASPLAAKTTAVPGVTGGAAQSFRADQDVPAQWWTLFQSQPLNDLMARALAASPTLQAAQANLRAAEETYRAAGGSYLPRVDANLSAVRQKTTLATGGTTSPFTLYNANVSVSYTPDLFGNTARTVEAAAAEADRQRALVKAAYLSLQANIVTAAIQEAALNAQIDATREVLDIRERQLGVLRNQLTLGGIAKTAVLQQEAVLAQTQATLPPLQKRLAQTQNLLKTLAGGYPHEKDAARFDLATLKLPEVLPVTLPSNLVRQRPDILAAESALHVASANVGLAQSNRLPQVSLSAAYGRAATTPANLFGPSAIVWSAGGSVMQSIFDAGTLKHRQRAAEATYAATEAQYRSTVLSAFQEVSDALNALEFDAASLKAAAAALKAADDSLHLSQQQFLAGSINYLALLDAQNTYQQTRIDIVTAQADRYADTVALFAALGGGWWNDNTHKDARK